MPKTTTVKIDMGEKCGECGKEGACQNGLCLKCTGEALLEKMTGIERCVLKGWKEIGLFLRTQSLPLRAAYDNLEECLTVSMTIKVIPAKERGQYGVGTTVSFVTDKVNWKKTTTVSPNQRELGLA